MNRQPQEERPDDCLYVTPHADFRWVQRAHEFDRMPNHAWHRSKPVELNYLGFDRVRYDEQTETLLCVNNKTLVTILRAKYESFAAINR
jgi:hypothetical protein